MIAALPGLLVHDPATYHSRFEGLRDEQHSHLGTACCLMVEMPDGVDVTVRRLLMEQAGKARVGRVGPDLSNLHIHLPPQRPVF